MNFTLTGDSTYAGIVFSPKVEGVDQVEVTLTYDEDSYDATDGERTFTLEHHAAAERYARKLAAGAILTDKIEALIAELRKQGEKCIAKANRDLGDVCPWDTMGEQMIEDASSMQEALDEARAEVEA